MSSSANGNNLLQNRIMVVKSKVMFLFETLPKKLGFQHAKLKFETRFLIINLPVKLGFQLAKLKFETKVFHYCPGNEVRFSACQIQI